MDKQILWLFILTLLALFIQIIRTNQLAKKIDYMDALLTATILHTLQIEVKGELDNE